MTRSIVAALSLLVLSTGACARTVMDQPVNRVGDGWTLIVRKVTDGPNSFDEGVMEQMRRLMRRSLREGRRIVWDEPTALIALYHAAGGN